MKYGKWLLLIMLLGTTTAFAKDRCQDIPALIEIRFLGQSMRDIRALFPERPLEIIQAGNHILVWNSRSMEGFHDQSACVLQLYFNQEENVEYLDLSGQDPCSCLAFLT